MAGYFDYVVSVISSTLTPFLQGSAIVPRLQEPPSLLERKVEQNGRLTQGNRHDNTYNPSVTVSFHRGVRTEAKKLPAPVRARVHGYTAPRCCYRKAAEKR